MEKWIKNTCSKVPHHEIIVATFVISTSHKLLLSDRHAEHVQCANGANVLSAGEIGFEFIANKVQGVSFLSNQSTGYCPSPKSWHSVEECLQQINGLHFPDYFDPAFQFSYCPNCESLKIIKDNFYYCYKCEGELYDEASFQKQRAHFNIK